MNFVVLRSEGTMAIDNAPVELDSTSLLPEIEMLCWRGEAGRGFIEYNDRVRLTEKIGDLTPYLFLIDAWLDAAAQQPEPISLAQAKKIKIDTVEGLYKNKRIGPFLDSATGWLYDGADEAVSYMSALVAATGVYNRADELVGRIDAAFLGIVGAVNGNVATNNASADAVNGWSATMASNWAGLDRYTVGGSPFSGMADPAGAYLHSHVYAADNLGQALTGFNSSSGSGGFASMSSYASVDTSVSGGVQSTVTWQPLNASSPVAINAIQFRDALRGIMYRRITLDSVRAGHKRAIQALTSIAAVVAYDVALGWP